MAGLYPPEKIPLPETVSEPMENLPPDLQNRRHNEKTPWNLAKAVREPDLQRSGRIFCRHGRCFSRA